MEKKLRIQLFDEEGRLVDDRTVSQDSAMYSGPKVIHQGLFRIEFTLDSKEDIEKAKVYLDKLIGSLPLGPKKIKKAFKEMETPQFREELLETVLSTAKNQDDLIALLRKDGFKFMMTDFLETFDFPGLNIKPRHKERYQWMLKNIRYAKNPKSDKYDPMLIFGIQLLPEHNERIVVYLNGEFQKSYKVLIPSKPKEVFKKTNMTKFPQYMIEEEREKFRLELRQLEGDPDRKPSKFFNRWAPYIENLPKISQDEKEVDSD